LVGTTVAKYRVLSQIGTGGMGDVYEAEADGVHVALKVLRLDDDKLAARFLREAKTMSLFRHPNIVELVEVGTLDDGRLFFAAELVRGITLRQLLDAGVIETKRALAIVRQILDALGHAHAMGVVHRDIKPENVMLADGGAPDGQSDLVKILDFGVAKLIGDTPTVLGEGTLTITGYGALGTPYYMSPEAVLGRPLDGRADIYSIGALLFELLAGKPPYSHEDVATLMRMHAAAPIPALRERAPDRELTQEIDLVINESLAKKPELRFKTAAEMMNAIDAAIGSLDPFFAEDRPTVTKKTDLFGELPLKEPARVEPSRVEPSASSPASFSPSSIPSASQPVQPDPGQSMRAHRPSRPNLPGVAPYVTPASGAPAVVPARASTDPAAGPGYAATANMGAPPQKVITHMGGPVMGVVVPANSPPMHQPPMFAPPMPQQQPQRPKGPSAASKIIALAKQHKKHVAIGGGVLVLLIIILVIATSGGDKKKSSETTAKPEAKTEKRTDLVRGAQELISAGHPSRAVELIERDDFGDDADVWLVLGHARVGANRRLDGVAAYERAIKLDKKLAADAQIKINVGRVLDSRDVAAGIVALELALRLDPPAQDLVKQVAQSGKLGDVRRRAFAIAEREKFSDGIDRVESLSLDLAQAANCEDRLAAVLKLRRVADPRAIPALKRAKTHRCVEREVAEAIAHLESQGAPPPPPNP
jgi:serine/threonine-protein kinase